MTDHHQALDDAQNAVTQAQQQLADVLALYAAQVQQGADVDTVNSLANDLDSARANFAEAQQALDDAKANAQDHVDGLQDRLANLG